MEVVRGGSNLQTRDQKMLTLSEGIILHHLPQGSVIEV